LIPSTSASAQSQAIILKAGDKAPFRAYLVPVEELRELENKAEKADYYKTELQKPKDLDLESLTPKVTENASFWTGTAVGGMVATILILILKR
jgi:hypothetical protein